MNAAVLSQVGLITEQMEEKKEGVAPQRRFPRAERTCAHERRQEHKGSVDLEVQERRCVPSKALSISNNLSLAVTTETHYVVFGKWFPTSVRNRT